MSQIFALKHVCVHESLSQFFEVAHLHVRYLLLKKKNLHFHDIFGWALSPALQSKMECQENLVQG